MTNKILRFIVIFTSLAGVLTIFGLFLYVNYLAPPLGDMWGHFAKSGLPGRDPISFWWRGYLTDNPRIGQLLLGFVGASKVHLLVAQAISLALLTITAAFVALIPARRTQGVSSWFLAAFLFLGLLTLGSRDLGQILFYPPRTANYAFAYGIVLAFLLPYLSAVVRGMPVRAWPFAVLMVALGLLAGLSNEHTIPAHVAALGVCLGVATFRGRPRAAWLWCYAGYGALVAGFLALFFAPGQSTRYSGVKYAGFEGGLSGLIGRCIEAVATFVAGSWALWLVNAILLALLLVPAPSATEGSGRALTKAERLFLSYALVTALAMAATVGASPLMKDSLYFASAVNLAIVGSFAAVRLAERRHGIQRALGLLIVVFAIALNARYWALSVHVYGKLHEQFEEREAIIQKSKTAGILDVVVPRYKINKAYKGFYRGDGLTPRSTDPTNISAAMYFGLRTIVVPKEE